MQNAYLIKEQPILYEMNEKKLRMTKNNEI